MSENVSFILYAFNDHSSFWKKKCSFGSTQSVLYIKKVESFLKSIKQNRDRKSAACLDQAAVSWKFGHYYFLRDFCDALCGNYELLFWKKDFFFHLRENGVNNCFKPLISSVFTAAASRLKSEQKEKEK